MTLQLTPPFSLIHVKTRGEATKYMSFLPSATEHVSSHEHVEPAPSPPSPRAATLVVASQQQHRLDHRGQARWAIPHKRRVVAIDQRRPVARQVDEGAVTAIAAAAEMSIIAKRDVCKLFC